MRQLFGALLSAIPAGNIVPLAAMPLDVAKEIGGWM
jgi:hypothetical protein